MTEINIDPEYDSLYGMFTPEGDEHVGKIIAAALALPTGTLDHRHSFAVGCLHELCDMCAEGYEAEIGQDTPFSEAGDTVVRERVYDAIEQGMSALPDPYEAAFELLATAIPQCDGYSIREDMNSADTVAAVYIDDRSPELGGSREDAYPTIAVEMQGTDPIRFTWQQARALIVALQHVEGVARNG